MNIINIYQAKTNLSQLIAKALKGEEIVIAKKGEPLVRLTPITKSQKPRVSGRLKGKIVVPENFNDEDPEINQLFYGKDTV